NCQSRHPKRWLAPLRESASHLLERPRRMGLNLMTSGRRRRQRWQAPFRESARHLEALPAGFVISAVVLILLYSRQPTPKEGRLVTTNTARTKACGGDRRKDQRARPPGGQFRACRKVARLPKIVHHPVRRKGPVRDGYSYGTDNSQTET